MDADLALDLYERINRSNERIQAIHKRRLPHARMERGKADKCGDLIAVDKWNLETERLYHLIGIEDELQSQLRTRLINAGYSMQEGTGAAR